MPTACQSVINGRANCCDFAKTMRVASIRAARSVIVRSMTSRPLAAPPAIIDPATADTAKRSGALSPTLFRAAMWRRFLTSGRLRFYFLESGLSEVKLDRRGVTSSRCSILWRVLLLQKCRRLSRMIPRLLNHSAFGPIDGVAPPIERAASEPAKGRPTASRHLAAKRRGPDGIAGRGQCHRGFVAGQEVVTVRMLFHRSPLLKNREVCASRGLRLRFVAIMIDLRRFLRRV